MKKCCILLIAVMSLALTACQAPDSTETIESETETQSESTETTKETEAIPPNTIDNMEKLIEVEDVISVTEETFAYGMSIAVAYKVLFRSGDTQMAADFVLPADYGENGKNYPILIYFPELPLTAYDLGVNFAQYDIIVVRLYARGYGESEGSRDLGGPNDLADAKKLLQICDEATFMKDAKMFVAGSSEGSITALRLLAEDTANRLSGCAIVDAITDLPAMGNARGEAVQNLFASLIGKTYEGAPEAYDLRSAVKFHEKLNCPLLILHYTRNPLTPIEQADNLYNLLKDTNKNCSYYKIDVLTSDFSGEGLQRLLSWIKSHD